MTAIVAKWIDFRIYDQITGKSLFHSGFSGSSRQRRVLLRNKIRELSKGRAIFVRKYTWVKGNIHTKEIEWEKNIPAW